MTTAVLREVVMMIVAAAVTVMMIVVAAGTVTMIAAPPAPAGIAMMTVVPHAQAVMRTMIAAAVTMIGRKMWIKVWMTRSHSSRSCIYRWISI